MTVRNAREPLIVYALLFGRIVLQTCLKLLRRNGLLRDYKLRETAIVREADTSSAIDIFYAQ